MTRKDFEQVATIIRNNMELDYVLYGYIHTQLTMLAESMATELGLTHKNFNKEIFIAACQPRSEITDQADRARAQRGN